MTLVVYSNNAKVQSVSQTDRKCAALWLQVDPLKRQRDHARSQGTCVRRTGAGVGRGWGPTLSRHSKLMTHTFVKRVVALEGLACRFEEGIARRGETCHTASKKLHA